MDKRANMVESDERMSAEVRVWERQKQERKRKLEDVHRPLYYDVGDMDIGGIRPMRNQVLARVLNYYDSRYIRDGDYVIDLLYNPNQNIGVWVEVVGLPESYGIAQVGDGRVDMEVYTDMALEIGDRCMVRYLGLASALGLGDVKGDKRSFKKGDEYFVMLNYRDFILRKNVKTGIEMVNGWVLMSSVDKGHLFGNIDYVGDKVSIRYGRIEAVGARVLHYIHPYAPDLGEVKVGDYVAYMTGGDIPAKGLEGYGDRYLYRCPVRHIVAKFEMDGVAITDGEGVRILSEI